MPKNTLKSLASSKKTLINQVFFLIKKNLLYKGNFSKTKFFLIFPLFFSLFFFLSPSSTQAQITLRTVADWEAGSIVLLNGHQFIKLNPPGGDGYFMALEPACYQTEANFTSEVKTLEELKTEYQISPETETTLIQADQIYNGVGESSQNPLQEYLILTSPASGIGASCSWTSADPTHQLTPLTPNSCTIAIPIFPTTTNFTLTLSGCNLQPLAATKPINPRPTMQAFTKESCQALPACSGSENNYTCPPEATIELLDERDNKTYTIRRLPDGNCWMVDNLAYGGASAQGGSDACASKTSFNGNTTASPTNRFGLDTYGECRNNPNNPEYGYLYNWQAVMQQPTATYNVNYSGSQYGIAGLCPAGWTVPTGGKDGEFYNLSELSQWTLDQWRSPSTFNGIYTGYSTGNSTISSIGTTVGYWTSTQISKSNAYDLGLSNSGTGLENNYSKIYGFSLRCLISFPQTPNNFSFICSPNQIDLDVAPISGDTLRWYDSPDAITPVHEGLVFSPATPTTPLYYYVSTYNSSTGEESDRLAIPISANQCLVMQEFTKEKAQLLTQCTQDECFPDSSLELVDERDNKQYTVRRLPDGNIWMVDNLAYGGASAQGGVNGCANRSTFIANGSANPSNRFGPGTYGDCIDPAVATITSGHSRHCGSTGTLVGQCGYYYNWQAVMQEASAYYNTSYTGSQANHQGLCPSNFIVPEDEQYVNLDITFGGSGANSQTTASVVEKWRSIDFFNITLAGYYTTSSNEQGYSSPIWSATQLSTAQSNYYSLAIGGSTIFPNRSNNKNIGFPLRCLLPLE